MALFGSPMKIALLTPLVVSVLLLASMAISPTVSSADVLPSAGFATLAQCAPNNIPTTVANPPSGLALIPQIANCGPGISFAQAGLSNGAGFIPYASAFSASGGNGAQGTTIYYFSLQGPAEYAPLDISAFTSATGTSAQAYVSINGPPLGVNAGDIRIYSQVGTPPCDVNIRFPSLLTFVSPTLCDGAGTLWSLQALFPPGVYQVTVVAAVGGGGSALTDPFFQIDPSFADAGLFSLTFSPGIDNALAPIPEPSSLILMSSALPGLLGFAWLRRRKSNAGVPTAS